SDTLLDEIATVVATMVRPFDEVAVAYSGGLDSTLVAALARRSTEVRCYCACVESSFDEANAAGFARQDGLEVDILGIADDELEELVRLAKSLF
ncbi:TPA: hypothetical protein HA259_06095, partial [Thermoplasmata archaeon]|nr:hypothetical protein [Thermoplasmata archaeon]